MKRTRFFLAALFLFPNVALTKDKVPVTSATEAPSGLLLPSGVGIWYFGQQQEYVVTALSASSRGFPIPGVGAGAITKIENRIDQGNLKADHWIFPWLNVHGILGTADGEAAGSVNPRLGLPLSTITVGYDALVYGGGVTLIAGGGSFFASVTADYTWGDVEFEPGAGLTLDDPSGIETLILNPKVGWYGDRGALWIGACYQHSEHVQTGTFLLPRVGPVNFSAEAEDKTPWIPVIGGEFFINEHWSITGEFGIGEDRRQGLAGVTFRF